MNIWDDGDSLTSPLFWSLVMMNRFGSSALDSDNCRPPNFSRLPLLPLLPPRGKRLPLVPPPSKPLNLSRLPLVPLASKPLNLSPPLNSCLSGFCLSSGLKLFSRTTSISSLGNLSMSLLVDFSFWFIFNKCSSTHSLAPCRSGGW